NFRRHGLCGCATHERIRVARSAGSAAPRHPGARAAAWNEAGHVGRVARIDRSGRRNTVARALVVWRERDRSADICRYRAAIDIGCARGLLDSGPTGDQGGSDGCAQVRVMSSPESDHLANDVNLSCARFPGTERQNPKTEQLMSGVAVRWLAKCNTVK